MWLHIAHGFSVNNISNELCLSERTVERYITKFEHTGDVQSTTQRHGPVKLLGDFEQLLQPGNYLQNTKIHGLYKLSYTAHLMCTVVMNQEQYSCQKYLCMILQC